jgi:hypothetical protein
MRLTSFTRPGFAFVTTSSGIPDVKAEDAKGFPEGTEMLSERMFGGSYG